MWTEAEESNILLLPFCSFLHKTNHMGWLLDRLVGRSNGSNSLPSLRLVRLRRYLKPLWLELQILQAPSAQHVCFLLWSGLQSIGTALHQGGECVYSNAMYLLTLVVAWRVGETDFSTVYIGLLGWPMQEPWLSSTFRENFFLGPHQSWMCVQQNTMRTHIGLNQSWCCGSRA